MVCDVFKKWILQYSSVDVIQLKSDSLILDEHDISYEGDRKRFAPISYENDTDHYQFMYIIFFF